MNTHLTSDFSAPIRRVAIVSLSGPSDPEAIRAGAERLRAHYEVVLDPRAFSRTGFLAGDDQSRAASLLDALCDPAIDAIVCARGGYGITRILEIARDAITNALTKHRKPISGFSDVTALHALWQRVGVQSVHGAMVAKMGSINGVLPEDLQSIVDTLNGHAPAMKGLVSWQPGEATGVIKGGNLAMLTSLLGTPDQYDLRDSILLLEDVGERPYRVDRMLTQLRNAGALHGVRAVVLGDWCNCDTGPDGVSIEQVLRERLCSLQIPVYSGAPFGHGQRAQAFALGDVGTLSHSGVLEFALQSTVC